MDCKEAEKLVIPYIRDELGDEQILPFISHVRECRACYDELEIYYTIHHMLEAEEEIDENAFHIRQRIEEDFEQHLGRIKKEKRKRALQYVLIAVGILLLFGLIVAALRPDETVEFLYGIWETITGWRRVLS